jgi:hypothetical protein
MRFLGKAEIWRYQDVPEIVWTGFDQAPSPGSFYGLFVKGWNEKSPADREYAVERVRKYIAGLAPSVGYRDPDPLLSPHVYPVDAPPGPGHNHPPEPTPVESDDPFGLPPLETGGAGSPARSEPAEPGTEAAPEPHENDAGAAAEPSRRAELLALRAERLAAAERWVTERPVITDQATAERCGQFLTQIADLDKRADAAHKAEKEPHLAAGREVDAFWRDYKTMGAAVRARLKPIEAAWLQSEKDRIDREAEKLREIAKAKAEAARQAAAEAEVSASPIAASLAADQALIAAADAEKDAARAAKAKPQNKGAGMTRAVGLRETWSARIDDVIDAIAHYLEIPEDRARILELVQSLADRDVRGGAGRTKPAVPGTTAVSTKSP